VIIITTVPRRRLLGQRISLGFKIGEKTTENRFLIVVARAGA
jgi:hypothetical protein